MKKVNGYKYFRSTGVSRLLGVYRTGVRKRVQASRIHGQCSITGGGV